MESAVALQQAPTRGGKGRFGVVMVKELSCQHGVECEDESRTDVDTMHRLSAAADWRLRLGKSIVGFPVYMLQRQWGILGNSRNIASFDRDASTETARIIVVELRGSLEPGHK